MIILQLSYKRCHVSSEGLGTRKSKVDSLAILIGLQSQYYLFPADDVDATDTLGQPTELRRSLLAIANWARIFLDPQWLRSDCEGRFTIGTVQTTKQEHHNEGVFSCMIIN